MDYLLYKNALKVFRLFPRPIMFQERRIDPLEQLPQAKCIMLLLQGYAPYEQREGKPHLSAYYVASNRLHQIATRLVEELNREHRAVLAKLPLKSLIDQANIGRRGVNSLCGTEGLGTFFTAQAILTDAFEPQEYFACDKGCVKCNRCVRACPNGALSQNGFKREKCIRHHLDNLEIPEEIKWIMPGLLGCDICQQVCPRNAAIKPYPMPEELDHIFTYRNIITRNTHLKDQFAMAVGSNMRGRVRGHAFILAARQGVRGFAEFAKKLLGTREEDPAKFYLENADRQSQTH